MDSARKRAKRNRDVVFGDIFNRLQPATCRNVLTPGKLEGNPSSCCGNHNADNRPHMPGLSWFIMCPQQQLPA